MKKYLINIIYIILLVTFLPGCRKKNQPPYAPYTPIGPSSGVTGFSYIFVTMAIDPDGDSVALRFDWGDGDTSDWTELVATEEVVATFHTWSTADIYYIRTQAKDDNENTSEWSLPLYFVITQNLPPNLPSIPSGPSVGYTDTFYLFSSSAIDPEGENVAIRFDWGDEDTSEWSDPVPNRAPVLRAHFWSYPDTYYVRAQAKGVSGEITEWSQEHQIIILNIEKFNFQNNNKTIK